MVIRKSVFILVALLALLVVGTGRAQAPDPQSLASSLIDELAKNDPKTFWKTSATLEDVVAKAPTVVDALVAAAETRPSPFVKLGIARPMYAGGKKREAVTILISLAKENTSGIGIPAADLCCKLVKNDTGFGAKNELSASVQEIYNAATDPYMKISAAKLNYFVAGGTQPWKDLQSMLESSDTAVKEAAAIALAECGNFPPAMETLRRLAKEPTERGRFASELLAKKELQDLMDRRLLPLNDPKYNLLSELISIMEERYVDPEKVNIKTLMTSAAKGMSGSLDPFTSYLDEKAKKKMEELIKGQYAGIGAYVNMRDGVLTIDRPIYSGPAYEAGLRSLDKVIEVEGETTYGKDLDELTGNLKGVPGTMVTIKVLRKGWTEAREFKIKRAFINVKTAKYQSLPGDIGYLQVTSFSKGTFEEISDGITVMKNNGMKSLIVDMRDNGGGLLDAAVNIVDLFVTEGQIVVTTKSRNNKKEEEYKTRFPDKLDMPVVVLINGSTASAAEIFSGCLQDYNATGLCKAVLVGEQSFGKGSVQRMYDLKSTSGETQLRLTIAKYYLPSGRCIHRDRPVDGGTPSKEGGVSPDIEVKPPEREFWLENAIAMAFDSGEIEKYAKDHYEANKDLFKALADDDGLDYTRYPDFEEVYNKVGIIKDGGNEIKIDRREIRRLLKNQVRRLIADERKSEFLFDYEDVQLQRAIIEALKQYGGPAADSIPAFKPFAHNFDPKPDGK